MFTYFLKGINKCQDRADVVHLSKKLLQNMHLLDTQEISLCLNKLSKVHFEDRAFWDNVCRIITTTDVRVVDKFKCLRARRGGDINGHISDHISGHISEGVSGGIGESVSFHTNERTVSGASNPGCEETTSAPRRDKVALTRGVPQEGHPRNINRLNPNEGTQGSNLDGEAQRNDLHSEDTRTKDKILYHFNMEELCLVLNALAKVNMRNEEILKVASEKIISEFEMNRHVVNTIKAIGIFGVAAAPSSHSGRGDPIGQALQSVYKNYDRMSGNLTERDISVLIRVMLTRGSQTGEEQPNGNWTSGATPAEAPHGEEASHVGSNNVGRNDVESSHVRRNHVVCNHLRSNPDNQTASALIDKLISSVKKINHISEQSIALILNACTKSCVKNKALLDMLKIVVILKLKQDKNKCSDIFVSSVTHSYSSFVYRDRVLYDTIAEYVCANIDGISVKALVIILNNFVNVDIVNVKMFNAALGRLARREVINGLSNQCTSNVVTIVTKSYNYLCTEKTRFVLQLVKGRLRREFSLTGVASTKLARGKAEKGAPESRAPLNDTRERGTPMSFKPPMRSAFLEGFFTKHLTNILNNLSKLNHADANLFALFSHLILRKKNEINKLDFLNITSAYARFGYVDEEIYNLIRRHAKKHLADKDLKYMEFINMFTSMATFSLIERNRRADHRTGDPSGHFGEIIHVMIEMLRGGANSRRVLGGHGGNTDNVENLVDDVANHIKEVGSRSIPQHHARINDKRSIIDNLSAKHTCCILATMSKLDTHDRQIYEQCVKNIRRKIFKMDSRSLTMYLLYVSKFGLIPDRYIREIISDSFKTAHLKMGETNVAAKGDESGQGEQDDHGNQCGQSNPLDKMSTLCAQLQTEDVVNAVYIVRSLIKNDPDYRASAYVMCAYLEGIHAGMQGRSRSAAKSASGSTSRSGTQSRTPSGTPSKRESDQNIIHIDEAQADDPSIAALLSGRKLNTQTACILMNTLAFINTHLRLPCERYAKMVSYLLLFSLRFMVDRLNLRRPLRQLLYEGTSPRESMNRSSDRDGNEQYSDIEAIVRRKIDSASIRQINMTILMIFHLGSLNPFCYSPQWDATNLVSYPLRLLQCLYFFLKFSPLTPFERYTSVYNGVSNRRKLTNYCGRGYAHVDATGSTSERPNKLLSKLPSEPPNRLPTGLLPSISEGEINIYQTVASVLKRKVRHANCTLLSTYSVYMYSVDVLILRGGGEGEAHGR
ncbi:hypothetical protein C922_03266 [Plasmodium inui San Antonio 1]|uniref:Uncharacterized protein n=1 Tax=Plasmodium inui San Antonio 1 TaxID=1237626 RepID=W7A3W8_9APIC|nr:hypothetical protein C922_03266 [Plasmodium inui San Antonio 1]EUD66350.1 hypothetical protein C922_03266 [Plasmodium inui San Antonio 1]